MHLLQKTEILSVIHLDSKRYQLQEFKKDQNTPLTSLHRSGNSFSCIDYHKIYTCAFINFRMKNISSNASVINTYPSSSSKINFPSRAEKIATCSAFVIEAFLIKTPNAVSESICHFAHLLFLFAQISFQQRQVHLLSQYWFPSFCPSYVTITLLFGESFNRGAVLFISKTEHTKTNAWQKPCYSCLLPLCSRWFLMLL